MENLAGEKYELLTPVKYLGNRYWECECKCGNITKVKSYNIKNGHTKSCGCLAKEQSPKNGRAGLMDLKGKRFGKLKVIEYVGGSRWKCQCDCDNISVVHQNNLCRKDNATTSCGCNVTLQNANAINIVEGTNVGNIKTKKPLSNSKTGIRGVSYISSKKIYIATISFQRKRYYLCSSVDIEKCIIARKEAEKRIFGDFLIWYENEFKKEKRNDL